VIVVACDPGLTGAFALYDTEAGTLAVHDTPTLKQSVGRNKDRAVLDHEAVINLLTGFQMLGATHFVIEHVQGLPGQSAPAAFNFAGAYFVPLMAARMLGYTIERVKPEIWKARLRVPKDKNGTASRNRASEMLPAHKHMWPLVKHDGRAEAALIAVWAAQTLGGAR